MPATRAEITNELQANDGSRIRSALPDLRFSQITLRAIVRISGMSPNELTCEPGVLKFGQFYPVSFQGDHCVVAGSWHAIDLDSLRSAQSLVADHGIAFGEQFAIGRYLSLQLDPRSADILHDNLTVPSGERSNEALPAMPAPQGLHATLYPYQVIGSSFLRGLSACDVGSLLADEMGLGKTVQAITLLLDQPFDSQSLVIAPASLLINWQREIEQFAPELDVLVHIGADRSGVAGGFRGYRVVVTSYDTAVNDLSILEGIDWNVVVLDEAQKIRNPDSQRAVAVKQLNRRLGVAVTGTPVENKLQDLWSIAEFVLPALLGSRDAFERQFPNDQTSAALTLGRIIAPITLRRKVSEVAQDLPTRVDIRTALPMDRADTIEHNAMPFERGGLAANVIQRVICAHGQTQPSRDALPFHEKPKVKHLIDLLREIFATGEKALIFASFTLTLDRLRSLFDAQFEGSFISVVDGRTDAQSRQEVIDAFSSHRGPGCLLLNPSAAGVGLNITAANHVIHFNPEWNPALTAQATARAYRRKQELPVFVHHLFYVDSIEEATMRVADEKRERAAQVDTGVNEIQRAGDTV